MRKISIVMLSILLSVSFLWISVDAAEKQVTYSDISKKRSILMESIKDYKKIDILGLEWKDKAYKRMETDYKILQEYYSLSNWNSNSYGSIQALESYIKNMSLNNILSSMKIMDSVYIKEDTPDIFKKSYTADLNITDKEWKYYMWIYAVPNNNWSVYDKNVEVYSDELTKVPAINFNMRDAAILSDMKGHPFKMVKVDPESFQWDYNIALDKFVTNIEHGRSYTIAHWFYKKQWDNYLLISKNSTYRHGAANLFYSRFELSEYSLKRSFENMYMTENGITNYNRYSSSQSSVEKDRVTREALYTNLDVVFSRYKAKMENSSYIAFLKKVKQRVVDFNNSATKNSLIDYKTIINQDAADSAYEHFKVTKDKLKIVDILISYLSDEIYKNSLEDTLKDFLVD